MRPLPPGTTFGIVSDSFHRAIPSLPNSEFSISGKDGTGHLSARQESEREGARPSGQKPVPPGLGWAGETTPGATGEEPVSAGSGRVGVDVGCDDSLAATRSATSPPKLDPTSASFR